MRQQTSISHSENIYYFYVWQDGNITCGHNVIVNPNGVFIFYRRHMWEMSGSGYFGCILE